MSVVARLSCHYVEHTAFGISVKMQPVVPQDDPHDQEIKQFFAATPVGAVKLAGETKTGPPLGAKPGDQFYLYLVDNPQGQDEAIEVKVTSVTLGGYATQVKLSAPQLSTPPWHPCEMEFTIRNELAAEQFQPGARFYARFSRIG